MFQSNADSEFALKDDEQLAKSIQTFLSAPESSNAEPIFLRAMEYLRIHVKETMDQLGEEGGDKVTPLVEEKLNSLNLNLETIDTKNVLDSVDGISDREAKKVTTGKDEVAQQQAAGRLVLMAQFIGYIEQNGPKPTQKTESTCKIV